MTAPHRKRGRQSAHNAHLTREDIITSAIELFAEHGYEATSLRHLARAAGVTHGTLRHHFGGKFEIWKAVADQVLADYQAQLLPNLDHAFSDERPLEVFRGLVRGFISVSLEHPVFARLLLREGLHPSPRAEYVRGNFLQMHSAIEPLFLRAREQCPRLAHHSNDSFFLALLSLTYFPLLLPEVAGTLGVTPAAPPAERAVHILETLLGPAEEATP
ncbi:MAG: TetR/AcrR family transcriptional regulator [Pseudomonadota bacterium]|nr:TetR/AcrR family transcriptional regulator [Pseudomonadota bacterium]